MLIQEKENLQVEQRLTLEKAVSMLTQEKEEENQFVFQLENVLHLFTIMLQLKHSYMMNLM